MAALQSDFIEYTNPFTLDSTKPKIDKLSKITNWAKSNEWSHYRVLAIELKARKICITQGLTLGVKGLKPK